MVTININQALRSIGIEREHDVKERAENKPSFYNRLQGWAEEYANYKIERELGRRFP